MPKQIIFYECNICQDTFDDDDLAEKCEQEHHAKKSLQRLYVLAKFLGDQSIPPPRGFVPELETLMLRYMLSPPPAKP